MTEALHELIDALRQELKQQGEMLARLDQQQDMIVGGPPDDVLISVQAIQDQSMVIAHAREVRQDKQRNLAAACQLPADSGMSQILESVPEVYRPLLQALVEETNECLVRIQQRARQNQVLLRRAVDLMQDMLRNLVTPGQPAGYGESGGMARRELAACGLLYDISG